MSQSIYSCRIDSAEFGYVIWAIDSCKGVTITNNAKEVVRELVSKYGDYPIIYKDTDGVWDGLGHEGEIFTHFIFLNCLNKDDAKRLIFEKLNKRGDK